MMLIYLVLTVFTYSGYSQRYAPCIATVYLLIYCIPAVIMLSIDTKPWPTWAYIMYGVPKGSSSTPSMSTNPYMEPSLLAAIFSDHFCTDAIKISLYFSWLKSRGSLSLLMRRILKECQ